MPSSAQESVKQRASFAQGFFRFPRGLLRNRANARVLTSGVDDEAQAVSGVRVGGPSAVGVNGGVDGGGKDSGDLFAFGPDGALLAVHRKIHLFDAKGFGESRFIKPGRPPSGGVRAGERGSAS
jgi:predicted amidohydrolase